MAAQQNWFETLTTALEAENLLHLWPMGKNLVYGETFSFNADGQHISIYRSDSGRYERPIHYATLADDTYHREPVELAGRALEI